MLGSIIGVIKWHTWSLDYNSYGFEGKFRLSVQGSRGKLVEFPV